MSKKRKKNVSSVSSKVIEKVNRKSQTKTLGESIHNLKGTIGSNDKILSILFLCLLLIAPLLVRVRVSYFVAPRIINDAVDSGWQGEIYTSYKWLVVMIIAIMAVIVIANKIIVKKYRIRPAYINAPLLVLVILVLASLLTSEYKSIALFGLYNQRDGTLIFLAYLALFLAAANVTYRPGFYRGVNVILVFFTIVNTVLALVNFTGHDLLQSALIKNLIVPHDLQNVLELEGSFKSTMNSLNYVSGFSSALFAFFVGGAILYKGRQKKLVFSLAALLAFTMVVASLSSSGFVTIVLILPLLATMALRSIDKKTSLSVTGIILVGCLIIFLIMNAVNPRVNEETFRSFGNERNATVDQKLSSDESAENVTDPNVDEATFWGSNLDQNALQSSAVSSEQVEEQRSSMDQSQDNTAGAPVELQLPAPGVTAGTGRLYIWKKTIKLIIERPILGYGAGTMAYYFPQDDINKVANLYDYNYLITKPHNMYLGIAFGYGIPALIVLLFLFGLHFIFTVKYIWQSQLNENKAFPVSVFLFFCAFLVQALFNDVVIDAGAVFWLLFGIGVALNFNPE